MNVALPAPWTLAEFLAWEERQEFRWEFDGFAPVAMTGGTFRHESIGGTLRALIREKLLGGRCRVLGPTLKTLVAGRIRYPDAMVVCVPVAANQTVIADPVVVFEVLSPSTAATDRIVKLREYQATPSIQRYVMLEQDSAAATVLVRRGEEWIASALIGDDVLRMPEIGVELTITEIYADSGLDAVEETAAGPDRVADQ